jgi:hypothetical protein
MTHLLRAASLTAVWLAGCTDQNHIDLGGNAPPNGSFSPATPARQLAVDATSLYWLSWNIPPPPGWQGPESSLVVVTKSDKDGGNATVLARTGFSVGDLASNYALRIDATHAYFTDSVFVAKARLDGSGVTTLVPLSAQATLGGMAIDDGMIYWSSSGDGVMQVAKAGGTPSVLGPPIFIAGQVAVDANSVYWIDSDLNTTLTPELFRMDKTGGASAQLAAVTDHTSLLADETGLYYEADNVIRTIGLAGTPTVMMSGATITSDLAGDADSIYVVRDHTTIVKIAKSGYAQTVLHTGAAGDPSIDNLAVDDTDVYWSDDDGNISHVGK